MCCLFTTSSKTETHCTWYRLHVFKCLISIACFLTLAAVACFTALGTGCLFSRAWYRLPVFPRFVPQVDYFPALCSGCLFSRVWNWLPVFPRLALAAFFPVLGTGWLFFRACHWLPIFPRLTPANLIFPALNTSCYSGWRLHNFYFKFWLAHCITWDCFYRPDIR